jgi:hypothetical protein
MKKLLLAAAATLLCAPLAGCYTASQSFGDTNGGSFALTSGLNTTALATTGQNYSTTQNLSGGTVFHMYNGDSYTMTPNLSGQTNIQDANGRSCTSGPPNLNGTVSLNCV